MKGKPAILTVFFSGGVLALVVLVQMRRVTLETGSISPVRSGVLPHEEIILGQTAANDHVNPEERPAGATQSGGEIAMELQSCFRREQVRMELELEQRRYGKGYWQAELGGKQLLDLDRIRSAQIARLTTEMNALLDGLEGGGPAERKELTPIFDAEHAGPNLNFLSPESRERIEALIASHSRSGRVDATGLLAEVERVLAEKEMIQYRQWNAPEHALLRNQLVGFSPTENEFNAVAQWPEFVNQGNSETGDGEQAELQLASRIGIHRLADLIRLRDPEMQTAVHDLHRLGLPLDQAESLAVFRSEGVDEIQQVWSDPVLPLGGKAGRVRQIQQIYRSRIAATFGLSATSSEATDLMP